MNRCPRIYYRGELNANTTIQLDEESSHHLLRVLRLQTGQHLAVFNGLENNEYSAELVGVENKKAQVKIIEHFIREVESPLKIILGQGISRAERMDYTLQKSVELGVYEIMPLFTERCGVELKGDRLAKKLAHWQQVVISACEQSGRCYVPIVQSPVSLEQWLKQLSVDLIVVADPSSKNTLNTFSQNPNTLALLCGPEGGFSETELALMRNYGVQGFSLGPRILRTETAALTAISL
ncbi:MAG TPA: 16S rRNA (uracil(1498)-N(3))-methyltransferase, partial [Coxiellaceae bacterium]|nr:16S rRNA (uracil(1498)-N(3))-methyltransferase [Coxiellaceae bacterium]